MRKNRAEVLTCWQRWQEQKQQVPRQQQVRRPKQVRKQQVPKRQRVQQPKQVRKQQVRLLLSYRKQPGQGRRSWKPTEGTFSFVSSKRQTDQTGD